MVILHYHIFKNAGTSIDVALKASFGDGWAAFEGEHGRDVLSADQLGRFLDGRPGLQAVSSHLARPPLPSGHCLPIVFLRHPILRARSVYEYVRRVPTQPSHDIARKERFKGFVRWALDGHVEGMAIRNYQVVHLSDASFRDAMPTQDDLRQACALLDSWGLVGIVESFARSLALYQRAYQPLVPNLALVPHWENRTRHSLRAIEDELYAVHDELGASLYSELLAHNTLDLALYDHGERLLARACVRHGIDDECLPETVKGRYLRAYPPFLRPLRAVYRSVRHVLQPVTGPRRIERGTK